MSINRDLDQLSRIPLSTIAAHDSACCSISRKALLNRLLSGPSTGACLAAIPQVVQWAPTAWPAYWCEIDRGGKYGGDCGVHADLAEQVLRSCDIDLVRCRAALRPYGDVKDHWTATWEATGASTAWIADHLVHHEVLRVGERFWDPTEACWFAGVGSSLSAGVVVATKEGRAPWIQLAE